MKIIVTGGAGFIGSHLTDKLIQENNQVIVIDNLSTGRKENLNPKADFYNLDINDFEKISPFFENIDWVFHLAAIPRVPVSIKDPINTCRTNILGAINVFKAASENKVKRVVFASSSSVYGNQKDLPLKEDMLPNPLSPYALQKFTSEKFAKLFVQLDNIPIICLRYFNVYGPRIDPKSEYSLVIGKFLTQKSQNMPLTIFGDGEQTRGFCYIDDVINANIQAIKSQKLKGGEIINIGSPKAYSINFLAKLIGKEVKYLDSRPGDIRHTQADISLAQSLLNWEPKTDFKKGLEKTKQWFEQEYGK